MQVQEQETMSPNRKDYWDAQIKKLEDTCME